MRYRKPPHKSRSEWYDQTFKEYYKPGVVRFSHYWYHYFKVLRTFTVDNYGPTLFTSVVTCDAQGNPLPGEKVRTHCTFPMEQDLKAAGLQTWEEFQRANGLGRFRRKPLHTYTAGVRSCALSV